MNINNDTIRQEILNYLQEGRHIVDNNKLKTEAEIVEELSQKLLLERLDFNLDQINEANRYIKKDLPKIRRHNLIEKLRNAIIPASLGVATALLINDPELTTFAGKALSFQNLSIKQPMVQIISDMKPVYFGGAIASAGYATNNYFKVNRKEPFENEKNAKTKYKLDNKVNRNFKALKRKPEVKEHGYGR